MGRGLTGRCSVCCGLILTFAFAGSSKPNQAETPAPPAPAAKGPGAQSTVPATTSGTSPAVPATDDNNAVVRTSMQNVEYHLTDRIIVDINSLNGRLMPNPGKIPVF